MDIFNALDEEEAKELYEMIKYWLDDNKNTFSILPIDTFEDQFKFDLIKSIWDKYDLNELTNRLK